MMRSAARSPQALPLSWAPPSGTRARDSVSLAFSVAAWAGEYVMSTRWAAAAPAASGDAPVGACLSHRYISYSPVMPTTALYIARWANAKYGKFVGPAGADTVVTVTSFQNVM